MTVRMPPVLAGVVIASIDAGGMTNLPGLEHVNASADASETWPSLAQQRCDALVDACERSACSNGDGPRI